MSDYKHVDRSHPKAANDPNGGTSNAPWQTIQFGLNQLKPLELLYIHSGVYNEHLLIDGRPGSPTQPYWVMAAPGVIIKDLNSTNAGLRVHNSTYWVLLNLELDGGGNTRTNPKRVAGIDIDHALAIVVHDCSVHGWSLAGVSLLESDSCIISTSRVENNVQEGDCHGMQVLWGCRNTLIWKNTTHGNSGDGIQVQQGHEDSLLPNHQPEPPKGVEPQNTTIRSNHFKGDRENGVDLKNCKRVSVQQNDFDGYGNEPAIVVHCSADEIVIERNAISNSCGGVTVGAFNGRVGQLSFRFNTVSRLTAGPPNTSGTALRVSHTRRAEIYHNTMVELDITKAAGVRLADFRIADTPSDRKPEDAAVDTAAVFNNIVVDSWEGVDYVLPTPGHAVGVLSLLSDFNVLFACKQPIFAAFNPQIPNWFHNGVRYDCNTSTLDPGLRSPATGDFTPTTKEAIDRAALLTFKPPWQQICRNKPDIGAIEVCP
jgi:hypothetical protein